MEGGGLGTFHVLQSPSSVCHDRYDLPRLGCSVWGLGGGPGG